MNSYKALQLFADQIQRNIVHPEFKTNVITLPCSFSPKGVFIKIAIAKTYLQKQPQIKNNNERQVSLRIIVSGTAESQKGLEMALFAIERLDNYLSQNELRLETEDGKKIANTRIQTNISEDDSFFDSPSTTSVQDVEDSRIVIITIPNNKE